MKVYMATENTRGIVRVISLHESIEGAWNSVKQEMERDHPTKANRASSKFCGSVWVSPLVQYSVLEREVLP